MTTPRRRQAGDPAPRTAIAGPLLGAHVSTQGGVQTAPRRAADIGATAIQVFTKTPNQWREPALEPDVCAAFRRECDRFDLRGVVAHDSYLINLASPDPALTARSVDAFVAELTRCEALGIPYLVSHPGNYIDDREAGLARNAERLSEALARAPGQVMVLLETTAGTGTALGSTFEELARLRALVAEPFRHRVGFCLDTCHVYSAGYDLVGDYDGVWAEWERVIGVAHLRCLHLNDSKTPFASRRDRHELIGEGSLGPEPFRRLMRDPRFTDVIKVIETPKGDDMVTLDRQMLRRLRQYASGGRPERARC
ncbi:MAG TPA: deoxyribonuclease IV [Gemmatimonadales bacterium]|nr:deoxyribonuclease IV [Gemmatimonadales bacterium]